MNDSCLFRREMETSPVLEVIQTLHVLTHSTIGRLAVVSVLSKGDLLEILVSLFGIAIKFWAVEC